MIVHNAKRNVRSAPRGYGSFGVFQIVPPFLVGPVRQGLQAQGVPGDVISDSGGIDGANLLTMAFDTVEIRTAATPPIKFSISGPPDPDTAALLNEIRPEIILTGRAGTARIDPYGSSGGVVSDTFKIAGVELGIGAVLAAIAGFFIIRSL